jgi:hypothetical protein
MVFGAHPPRAVTVAPTEIQPAGDGELANAETNREYTSRVAMRGAANTSRPELVALNMPRTFQEGRGLVMFTGISG